MQGMLFLCSNIHVKYYFSKQRENKEEVASKDVQTKTQKTPENEKQLQNTSFIAS